MLERHIGFIQNMSKDIENIGLRKSVFRFLQEINLKMNQTKPKLTYIIVIWNFLSSFIEIGPYVCSCYLLTAGDDENNIFSYRNIKV
jgi:hypothetical protein